MRELTKDLENIKGDLALNYQTIPIVYGEKSAKVMLTIMVVLSLIPIYLLLNTYELGKMNYFFYLCILLFVGFVSFLWKASKKIHYLILHNLLKVLIVAGVFSILLIDVNLLLNRII